MTKASEVDRKEAAQRGAVAGASDWPVDDISGLGRRLPEVDPAAYFDGQAKGALEQALRSWPVLARLMKLAPAGSPAAPVDPADSDRNTQGGA